MSKKNFSQWMADRRNQLTTKALAEEEAQKTALEEAIKESPFKRFNDRKSLNQTESNMAEPDLAASIAARLGAAQMETLNAPEKEENNAFTDLEAATETPVEQTVAPLKLEHPQEIADLDEPTIEEEVVPTTDAYEFLVSSTELFVENRIDVLRAKVSSLESTIRERLTARFGFGNEWRAFADRYLLDVVVGLERLKASQTTASAR